MKSVQFKYIIYRTRCAVKMPGLKSNIYQSVDPIGPFQHHVVLLLVFYKRLSHERYTRVVTQKHLRPHSSLQIKPSIAVYDEEMRK